MDEDSRTAPFATAADPVARAAPPAQPLMREIELKLAATPEVLRRLRKLPALGSGAEGPWCSETLRAIYYDTAERTLAAEGIGFRVRRSGRRIVQTVKTAGEAGAASNRLEAEAPLLSEGPDARLIPDPELRQQVLGLVAGGLVPVFETQIRRQKRVLARDGARIEVALDLGEIRNATAAEPVAEVELELLEGTPGVLFALARDLVAAEPTLEVALASKAERGHALGSPHERAAVKASPVALPEGAGAGSALAMVVRSCLAQVIANQPAVRAGLPDGVHQMRVALRRLRAALAAARTLSTSAAAAAIEAEARDLAQVLGAARDWDVFTSQILEPVQAAFPAEAGLIELGARAATARAQAWGTLLRATEAPRLTLFVLDAAAWAEDLAASPLAEAMPAVELARTVLRKRRKKATALGSRLESLSIDERHDLRKELKKLRYGGEFFESLFSGKAAGGFRKALAGLQDTFGALNDAATAAHLLETLVEGRATPEVARASGIVAGWHAHAATTAFADAKKRWDRFASTRPFWKA